MSGRGEDGGDAVSDQAQRGGVNETGADEVVGGALVAAAAAVEEQVGLGASCSCAPPAATARRIARSRPLRVLVAVMAISMVRGGIRCAAFSL